jgi:hypothetical protein
MFKNLRPRPCHRAPAVGLIREPRLPTGCGTAAGFRAAPTTPNGRSPTTGLAYRAAAQFRAAMPDQASSKKTEEIQS